MVAMGYIRLINGINDDNMKLTIPLDIQLEKHRYSIILIGKSILLQVIIEEELKSLLMKVKEDSANAGLKLNIQKTRIMAHGPITSWQIDGETMKTVRDFIFLDSRITADGECSHEVKRCLLLGRTAMTNLDSILKSRDITLLIKICIVKAMAFPVVVYGCESWSIRKMSAEELMLLNCCAGQDP